MSNTPWPHFSENELACHCNCGQMEMDAEFMERLEKLRIEFDMPMKVTSAFRCPNHNAQVSKTGFTGPHTTGKSIDIAISGQNAFDLVALAILHNFTGLGISQRGPHNKRFIHLDTIENGPGRPRPTIWSY
jgi:zinc D-Ala-D-Ala carboxypeptidase